MRLSESHVSNFTATWYYVATCMCPQTPHKCHGASGEQGQAAMFRALLVGRGGAATLNDGASGVNGASAVVGGKMLRMLMELSIAV